MTDPDDLSLAPRPWGPVRRLAFRFALIYFVLYALPFPFTQLWQTGAGFARHAEQEWGATFLGTADAEWMRSVDQFFYGDPADPESNGPYTDFWQSVTTWLGEQPSIGLEVIHQRTGSGDTAHDLLKVCAGISFALFGAVLWSLIDRRRRASPALARLLHLGVRWQLAFVLLSYGMIKLYAGQFSYPSLSRLMNPIGDTSPMGLVWTFMGFSKSYEVFSGLGECVGGLLLFWRRTSLLGCFVAIPVMANVVALNWMFDVPVKLFSTHLLVFAVALLLPDLPRLWALFVTNRPAPSANLRLTPSRVANGALFAFGLVWVGAHLYLRHDGYSENMEQREEMQRRPSLYGVWEVEEQLRDGEPVAPESAERWSYLAIDVRDRAFAKTVFDGREWLTLKVDDEAGLVSVAPLGGAAAPEPVTWTFERGEKTVQGANRAPKRMEDFRSPVDVVRQSLVLRGPWRGGEQELRLLRKDFALERGFHLVQEMPFNR